MSDRDPYSREPDAKGLAELMERQFGPDWRDLVWVSPLGVFPLRDVFAECGMRDPLEPEPRHEPVMLPPQVFHYSAPARDLLSPAANAQAALRYMRARYGRLGGAGGAWDSWPGVAGGDHGVPGAAVREPEREA